jgi:cell division septation protein DedD
MTHQERRQYSRKTLNPLPYINLPSGNGGIVLDVSEQGLRFRALSPVKYSGPIDFSFTAHSNLVSGTGEIVWIDEATKMSGLRFTELPYNALEQIRKLPCNSNLRPGFSEDLSLHIPAVNDSQSPATNQRGARAALTSKFASGLNRLLPESFGSTLRESWIPALRNAPAKLPAPSPTAYIQNQNRRLLQTSAALFLGIAILALGYARHRQAGELLIRMGTRLSGQAATLAPAPTVASQAPLVPDHPAYQAKVEDSVAQPLPTSVSAAAGKDAKGTSEGASAPQAQAAPVQLPKSGAAGAGLVVQVAALSQEVDARELTDKLRQENFQAFVGTLPVDSYYRVMLGPYADGASARTARDELKKAGFSSFIRRESAAERLGSLGKATPRQEPAT